MLAMLGGSAPALAGMPLPRVSQAAKTGARTPASTPAVPTAVGIWDGHGDVGVVRHAGATEFDPASKTYTLAGSGKNIWAKEDAFQFAWKKVSGDVVLAADVAFLGQGKDPHRKACLMIRQSLDADSAYVDVAVHGDGLTSLQFRPSKGATTQEVRANGTRPGRVRLDLRGGRATMVVADANDETEVFSGGRKLDLTPASQPNPLKSGGSTIPIKFTEPFYVGIGVCAHDDDTTERATFRNLELTSTPAPTDSPAPAPLPGRPD